MSSLVSHFNVKPKDANIRDYDLFSDKKVLMELKNALIEEILDADSDIIDSDIIVSKLDSITSNMNLSAVERSYLYNLVDNELNGYGPVDEALKDAAVRTIMVNSPSEVYIETSEGIFLDNSISFINDEHIIKTIQKLVENSGFDFDINESYIDIKLKDKSKLEVVLPPISLRPIFTIKKFNAAIASINELVRIGTMTPYMGRFLEACVLGKLNVIVCGGSQTGKSNLLNSLGNLVDDKDRVVVIDNDNTMEINKDNLVTINLNDKVNVFQLAKSLLPNELVVANLDDKSLLDAIVFMNNYKGVLTSIYSSQANVVDEMYRLILLNHPELSEEIVKNYINNAIDIVVFLKREEDGKIKVSNISEIDNGKLIKIFKYENNEFVLFDLVPKSYKKIKKSGIDLIDDIFRR